MSRNWLVKSKVKSENMKMKSNSERWKIPIVSSEWWQGGRYLVIGIEKWKWLIVKSKVRRQIESVKVTQKSETCQWVVNCGKEGEIESGRSAELENCGQAEVEDHLRMRMWNLLVMVMRMIMIIENGSIPIHYCELKYCDCQQKGHLCKCESHDKEQHLPWWLPAKCW